GERHRPAPPARGAGPGALRRRPPRSRGRLLSPVCDPLRGATPLRARGGGGAARARRAPARGGARGGRVGGRDRRGSRSRARLRPPLARDARHPGYRVLRWESDGGVFRDPAGFPPLSVATSGTHDTSALATWWEEELG